LAGLRMPSEAEQAAFRLAAYRYACVNGTSREAAYSGSATMSNGHRFATSIIPQAVGRMNIRRFFRSNMKESYEALKASETVERDEPRYVASVGALGISSACAFATADWLADCPMFTPEEGRAHQAAFDYRVQRSKRARGGRTLEEVESVRRGETLEAQGPATAGDGDF